MSSNPTFLRFLQKLHRRRILLGAIESAGLGLLAGSAVCILLGPLLLWRGRDAAGFAAVTLAAGSAVGALFGLLRRPPLFDTAMEADRQLALAELLGTAFQARGKVDEWSSAVIALADERCRHLSPSSLVLRRLGSRAWGGIGLSAALSIAIALLGTSPASHQARATDAETGLSAVTPSAGDRARTDSSIGSPRARHAEQGDPTAALQRDDAAERTSATAQPGTRQDSWSASAGDSTGAGAADSVARSMRGSASRWNSAPAQRHESTAFAAGGVGRATDPSVAGTDTAAGLADSQRPRVAPWQLATWPADRAAALASVRQRNISDSHRDLVRRYFADDPR